MESVESALRPKAERGYMLLKVVYESVSIVVDTFAVVKPPTVQAPPSSCELVAFVWL